MTHGPFSRSHPVARRSSLQGDARFRAFLTTTALCSSLAISSGAWAQTTASPPPPPPPAETTSTASSPAPDPASSKDASAEPKPTSSFVESQAFASSSSSPGDSKPSVFQTADENGVDLTDGSFNLAITEGTIGAGRGALSLERYIGVSGTKDNVSSSFYRSVSGGVVTIDIQMGSRREVFTATSSTATSFTSQQGSGATLTKLTASSYRYTASDGSVTMYEPPRDLTEFETNGFCGTSNLTSCSLVATSITDPDGVVTTMSWDAGQNCRPGPTAPNGEPTYICAQFWRQRGLANNLGYSLAFSFQQEANPTSGGAPYTWYTRSGATLSSGTATRGIWYGAPATGVTEINTDGGKYWRLTNNGAGYLTKVDPPGGPAIDIARAPDGTVTSVTRNGVTTTYARSVSGATATVSKTVPGRGTTTITSNLAIGRPTSVRNALNQTTSFAYDGNGRLTQQTAPEGDATGYTYDTRGNVTTTQAIAKPGSGVATITTSASFPATCASQIVCNKPTSSTDARGAVTNYTYDSRHGGLLTATAPAASNGIRPQTRFTYAQKAITSGTPVWMPVTSSACNTTATCAGTADETKTTIAYEATHLLPSSVRVAAGNNAISSTSAIAYDAVGNVVSVDGPLSGAADTTTAFYDIDRQVVGVIGADPDGLGARKRIAQRTTYDAAGRVVRQEVGTATAATQAALTAIIVSQRVDRTYDSFGRQTRDTFYGSDGAAVSLTQYGYTVDNLVECAAVRMNPAAYGSLPAACSLSTQGAAGPDRITKTIYDILGRTSVVQTAFGTAAQANEVSTAHTANGAQAWVQDGNGNRTTYTYDGLDRVVGMSMPSKTTPGVSSTTDYENYAYDPNGNLTSQRLRDGSTVSYGFDALNRMTSRAASANDGTMSFAYDLVGRMTSASDNLNVVVASTYDALGRRGAESSFGRTMTSQYDVAGRRTRLTYADGFFVTYTYSVTGEMLQVRENGATTGVGVLANYTYDDLGRRTKLKRGNGLETNYAFDPASRLQQLQQTTIANTRTFSYNPASEITQATQSNTAFDWQTHVNIDSLATINGLNQITQAGPNAITYDARGNLASDGTSSFVYNSRNQLLGYTGGNFYYDPVGRLRNLSAETQTFDYDGVDLIAEYGYNGALNRRYVHGPGVDEPIVWYEGAGTTDRRFYHADERGSIMALTTSVGNLIQRLTYDEYGIPGPTNNVMPNGEVSRFQYTGQKWIPSLGAYDYKARIYSPRLGRFLQTDPIGYGDGLNLYGYVSGDPVNGRDSSGLLAQGFSLAGFTTRIDGAGRGGSSSGKGEGGGAGGCGVAPPGGVLICGQPLKFPELVFGQPARQTSDQSRERSGSETATPSSDLDEIERARRRVEKACAGGSDSKKCSEAKRALSNLVREHVRANPLPDRDRSKDEGSILDEALKDFLGYASCALSIASVVSGAGKGAERVLTGIFGIGGCAYAFRK